MKLVSSAFPPGKTPPTHSQVHQQLEKHLINHPFPEPTIRKYEPTDIEQLKALQKEWFPINYSEQFYIKILEGAAQCFVAEITLTPDPKQSPIRAIAGAIVFQVTSQTDHLVDNWVSRMLSLKNNALYIMTLGVIDEMRSKGVAKRLLEEAFQFTQTNPKIQIVLLHVIAYNKRAINFYKKEGFVLLESIEEHYSITGVEYDGLKLGLFVNGGERREGWLPWLKRVILRRKHEDDWPK